MVPDDTFRSFYWHGDTVELAGVVHLILTFSQEDILKTHNSPRFNAVKIQHLTKEALENRFAMTGSSAGSKLGVKSHGFHVQILIFDPSAGLIVLGQYGFDFTVSLVILVYHFFCNACAGMLAWATKYRKFSSSHRQSCYLPPLLGTCAQLTLFLM